MVLCSVVTLYTELAKCIIKCVLGGYCNENRVWYDRKHLFYEKLNLTGAVEIKPKEPAVWVRFAMHNQIKWQTVFIFAKWRLKCCSVECGQTQVLLLKMKVLSLEQNIRIRKNTHETVDSDQV